MLDVHQLNVFLQAGEALNFTHAARLLHMTQPSVSQHVRALEEQLGVQLFNRDGRKIALTDAGLSLMPLARDMVRRSVHIEETIRSLQDEVHGHLLVACSTTPGKYLLPQLLAEFHHRYPEVRVSCQVISQIASGEQLSTGEVHFALVSSPSLQHKQVEYQHFDTDEIVMIVPRAHPWAREEVIEPHQLYGQHYIMREEGSGTQTVVLQALNAIGVDTARLEPIITLGNSEAIALAVHEGIGVGFVSRIVIERLALHNVAIVEVNGTSFNREIFLGRYIGHPATTAQITFWEFVAASRKHLLTAGAR